MEAFPWAHHSPSRSRAPPPMALVPSARYVSARGPAHPQPFSSWNDYLGLATLITKAVDRERRFGSPRGEDGDGGGGGGGSPPSSSSSSCCSPHAGAEPGALRPAAGPPDYEEDDDSDEAGGRAARYLGRPLRMCAGPAEAAPLEARFAQLSPFAGRAREVTPREELARPGARARAWAVEPRLHAVPGAPAAPLLKPELQVCVFCRNNKEAVALYTTHVLKGPDGRVQCPVLRRYTCPLCGANGDHAHTIKYCPLSKAQPPPAHRPPLRSARDAPSGRKLR